MKKQNTGKGVPLAKPRVALSAHTPRANALRGNRSNRSREYVLRIELMRDTYYPDNYGLFLQTSEHGCTRIAGEKQSGSWDTVRKWTVKVSAEDLAEATEFALAQASPKTSTNQPHGRSKEQ